MLPVKDAKQVRQFLNNSTDERNAGRENLIPFAHAFFDAHGVESRDSDNHLKVKLSRLLSGTARALIIHTQIVARYLDLVLVRMTGETPEEVTLELYEEMVGLYAEFTGDEAPGVLKQPFIENVFTIHNTLLQDESYEDQDIRFCVMSADEYEEAGGQLIAISESSEDSEAPEAAQEPEEAPEEESPTPTQEEAVEDADVAESGDVDEEDDDMLGTVNDMSRDELISFVQNEMVPMQNEITELARERDALREECAALKKDLEESQASFNALEEKLNKLSERIANTQGPTSADLEKLEKALSEAQAERDAFKADLEEVEAQAEKKHGEEIEVLEAQIKQHLDKIEALEADGRDVVSEEIAELEKQLSKKEAAIALLEDQLEEERAVRPETDADLDTVNELTEENNTLKKKTAKLEKQLEKAKAANESAVDPEDLVELELAIEKRDQTIEDLKGELKRAKEQLDKSQVAASDRAEKAVEKRDIEIKELIKQRDELQDQLSEKDVEMGKWKDRAELAEDCLESAKQEISDLTASMKNIDVDLLKKLQQSEPRLVAPGPCSPGLSSESCEELMRLILVENFSSNKDRIFTILMEGVRGQ